MSIEKREFQGVFGDGCSLKFLCMNAGNDPGREGLRMMPQYNLEILRGDTFASDYFQCPEGLEPDVQLWQVEEAIANGTARLRDWREYTIRAEVRIGNELWFNLSDYLRVSVSGDRFWFEIPAEKTQSLEPGAGVYDLQICKDGNVETILGGRVKLIPDVTARGCQ